MYNYINTYHILTFIILDIYHFMSNQQQLRDESNAQVENAKLAIAHGNGGMLGSRHTAGTIILGRD